MQSQNSHDLTVSGVALSANSGAPGDVIAVTFVAANDGNIGTEYFLNAIRWSDDTTITQEDVALRYFSWGGLGAFEDVRVGPIKTQIPATALPGTYYVAVCANTYHERYSLAVEPNVNNNCSYAPFTVTSNEPEWAASIQVQGVTSDLAQGVAGQTVQLYGRIKNSGGTDSGPIRLQFSLGYSTQAYSQTTFTLGTQSVPGISAGQYRAFGPIAVQIPESAPSGWAYLEVNASLANGGDDSESTPFLVGDSAIYDLQSHVQLPSKSEKGMPLSLSIITINNFATPLYTATRTVVYWSPDAMYASYNNVLADISVPFLDAGGLNMASISVIPPDDVPIGTNYITVCSDALGVVQETDETNNCETVPWTVAIAGSLPFKVQATEITLDKTAVAPGDSAIASYEMVIDNSSSAGEVTQAEVTAYLVWSADPIFNERDYVLASAALGNIAGSINTFSTPIKIPVGLISGTYYLGICSWLDSATTVSDWMHSCVPFPVQVQSEITNKLSIANVAVSPKTGKAGDSVRISFEVTNSGNAATPAFSNSIRWSADETISVKDPVLRNLPFGGLNAQETGQVGPSVVTVPENTKPGTYFVGICADLNSDSQKQVTESNQANNCSYFPFTVTGGNDPGDNGGLTW